MSVIQWSLLLLGIGVAALLIWSSRRERRSLPADTEGSASRTRVGTDWGGAGAASGRPAAAERTGDFDEYGVSRPRKRTAPAVRDEQRQQSLLDPEAGRKVAPSVGSDNRASTLVGVYIAEHERTEIFGPRIHKALSAHGLEYGARRIYHRLEGEETLFSVASLVKPGYLDPEEAAGFSTPGLSVFMVLPGPRRPVAAFEEMIGTARKLASSLNAVLFDSERREPLTPERERELHAQVAEWARRHPASGAPV